MALRHQITVLERQLGKTRPRFCPVDRVFPAALPHRLPRDVLGRFRLLVWPDTVLRWHRDLLARRHAARSRPWRPGRPPTVRSIRMLVLHLARENPGWGYRRIHGELLVLGVKTAASTVWEILRQAGIDPAPERISTTWADFLRSQADALLACDFFETVTLSGARMFVLAVIEGERLLFADAFSTKTFDNIKAWRKVTVSILDKETMSGFQLKGDAEEVKNRELVAQANAKLHEAGISTNAQRAWVVSVNEVYSLKPDRRSKAPIVSAYE